MKFQTIFAFGAVLTLAVFAGQTRAENHDEERNLLTDFIKDSLVYKTGAKVSKECIANAKNSMIESIKTTFEKYITKLEKDEPLYKKDKKFKLSRFIKHSLLYKTGSKASKECFQNAKTQLTGAFESTFDKYYAKFKKWVKG